MAGLQLDEDEFAQRLDEAIRGGCVTMGICVGIELGLFEVMSTLDGPFSVQDLANLTSTESLPLRQLLLMLAASDILQMVDADGNEFYLPNSKRKALTSPLSMAVSSAQMISLFNAGAMETASGMRVEGSLKDDSMILSKVFGKWQENRSRVSKALLPQAIEQIPGLQSKLENGCSILDVGCNKGDMVFLFAELFPNSRIVGIDPWSEAIDTAKAKAVDVGLSNVNFLVEDATSLPAEWTNEFDYVISINTLHHITDPIKACMEMYRVLSSKGIVSAIDMKSDADLAKQLLSPNAPVLFALRMFGLATGRKVKLQETDVGKSEASNMPSTKDPQDSASHFQTHVASFNHGGFGSVHVEDLPQSDFIHQVHIWSQK